LGDDGLRGGHCKKKKEGGKELRGVKKKTWSLFSNWTRSGRKTLKGGEGTERYFLEKGGNPEEKQSSLKGWLGF